MSCFSGIRDDGLGLLALVVVATSSSKLLLTSTFNLCCRSLLPVGVIVDI